MSVLPRSSTPARQASRPRGLKSLARRFARATRGAAALEFAIIATPFFLFLFAVIEVGYMFFVSVMIDAGTLEAARKIRTGQMQFAGATADDLWDDVCGNISIVAPCEGRLFLDVRTYDDFASTRAPLPIEEREFDPTGLHVDFGEEGDIVLVRSYYLWDVMFPDLGTGLANLNGGKRLMTSTIAFRNEPFGEIVVEE